MNFLNLYFKSKIFSKEYSELQLQEGYKQVKEEGETIFQIIQKHNPTMTKEILGEIMKPPKNFSRKSSQKFLNKYIKAIGLTAFKELMRYSLKSLNITLEDMVARILNVDFVIRNWFLDLIHNAKSLNPNQFNKAIEKFTENSHSEISLINVINSMILIQEREKSKKPWKLTEELGFLEFNILPYELNK